MVRIGIVGAGRAGGALGRALHAAGYPIAAVWSRTAERARTLARDVGARSLATPADVAVASDLTLLAIIDTQITPVSVAIARAAPHTAPTMVVHLSGANGAALLQPLADAGYMNGAFHPLQTFADDRSPIMLGTAFAIEAPEPLQTTLEQIAQALGGVPLRLAAADRALYHAAATITANYTIALMAQAAALLERCGLDAQASLAALLPLLGGTVANLARLGLPTALTGPITRGDVDTIARHLAALADRAPEILPVYVALAQAALPLAAAQDMDATRLATISALLREHAAEAAPPV